VYSSGFTNTGAVDDRRMGRQMSNYNHLDPHPSSSPSRSSPVLKLQFSPCFLPTFYRPISLQQPPLLGIDLPYARAIDTVPSCELTAGIRHNNHHEPQMQQCARTAYAPSIVHGHPGIPPRLMEDQNVAMCRLA